ncbi:MAG: M16 family metallopeptidase, partial [Cephaloticoccus sp.]
MSRVRLALVLWLFSLLPGAVAATAWPHEASDLAADPAVTWGALPNGLRYAIRPNAEPQDRVSLRFLVLAGSMHENDRERGLAHFLEHMAFRSTRDHPDGSLVATLQRLGIGFGPDNTAFTTHDYTIYHLELPDPSTATLGEALGVFRAYADGITFAPAEIDRERGVVLSELATRNVPEARAQIAQQTALLPRARQVARLPIGLEGQIRQFQAEDFQAFYDAWYRPERMILVLVGAVDPATAEKLITEKFASLTARGAPRPEPSPLLDEPVPLKGAPHLFKEPGIIGARVVYERAVPAPAHPNTRAHWQGELRTALAFHMLQRRLYRMGQASGASFTTAYVLHGDSLKNWRINTLLVNCSIVTWNLALRESEQELRRALEFGFTAAELQDARAHFRAYYEQGARSAATQRSEGLATALAHALAADRVFASATQIADLMLPWLDDVTLAECHQALRTAWGDEPPKVYVVSNS